MRKTLSKEQGSYTIEAILMMSTLLVILFLLCFSFMLMYQRVLLTKTASSLAQRAAKEWHQQQGLAHHVTELAPDSKTRVQTVEGEALTQLDKTIKKPERTTVEVQYHRGLITQEITVAIAQEVAVPLGQLKRFFMGKNTVTLTVEERVIIAEPAEFIRNTDLLVECAERVGKKVNLSEFWAKRQGKTGSG
ncbi:MAG: hypothetical protein PHC81_04110 [Clostridia bacterium]|nr:hypothetical protein [Clostridia bacterium]MDD4665720.1 hypothetical protein [Clostridia bacterium]